MRNNSKYKSTTGFQDLLFNNVIWFASLLFLVIILMNPPTKNHDVEEKAEVQIVMEWNGKNDDDVDLYVRDPLGNLVWFQTKNQGFMHLDRDDIGRSNDIITMADGTEIVVYINREVISLRKLIPGEYIVNIHMYSRRPHNLNKGPLEIDVEIIKVNPYQIISSTMKTLHSTGDEKTIMRFKVDADGKVQATNDLFRRLVTDMIRDSRGTLADPGFARTRGE